MCFRQPRSWTRTHYFAWAHISTPTFASQLHSMELTACYHPLVNLLWVFCNHTPFPSFLPLPSWWNPARVISNVSFAHMITRSDRITNWCSLGPARPICNQQDLTRLLLQVAVLSGSLLTLLAKILLQAAFTTPKSYTAQPVAPATTALFYPRVTSLRWWPQPRPKHSS